MASSFVIMNQVVYRLMRQWYERSIIITAQEVQVWSVQSIEQLDAQYLQFLINLQPDIIILGTGDKQQFLAPELMSLLWQRNIGCEVMNSNAACRTYNVLMSEDRAVVAGIII